MRLIDADALTNDLLFDIDLYEKALDNGDIVGAEREQIQFDKDCKQNCVYYLTETEPIDAVPVVRCKDCKHKPSGTGEDHDLEFPDGVCPCQCEDYWFSWKPNDDWFCADGERKEE